MNFEEIAALLHIEEKTREQPKLKAIHDAVWIALTRHNDNHVTKRDEDESEKKPQASQSPPTTPRRPFDRGEANG